VAPLLPQSVQTRLGLQGAENKIVKLKKYKEKEVK
jgi:hypothetical protein